MRNILGVFAGACVCNSYPCEWGGVVNGNPYLKNLDEFGKTVLEDLWTAVVDQFVEVSSSLIRIPSEDKRKLEIKVLHNNFC